MPMFQNDHAYWMQKAIELAKKANTPFGAIIVNEKGESIGAFNTSKQDGPTAHAEINAIQEMSQTDFDKTSSLKLYSTVEPCPMCMSAIIWAGISHVIYGATIGDASEFGRQIDITSKEVADSAWYSVEIVPCVERENCLKLFKNEIEQTADI